MLLSIIYLQLIYLYAFKYNYAIKSYSILSNNSFALSQYTSFKANNTFKVLFSHPIGDVA